MNQNIVKFKEIFQIIKNKGWVKSISNSDGSVGITFESLLGRKENNSVLPDYNGIELKCSASNSFHPITLFSINFDGPTKYETQRLANMYGKRDTIVKDKNALYASLSCNANYLVNNMFNFKIRIDTYSKIIYLVISDLNQNIIEEKCFIKFDTLQNHLITKLNYLAMVYANKKNIDGIQFFNYTRLEIYQLKSFDNFVKAIENDKIKISLILRISKSKANYGKPDYKNLTFAIKKYDLNYLFYKI